MKLTGQSKFTYFHLKSYFVLSAIDTLFPGFVTEAKDDDLKTRDEEKEDNDGYLHIQNKFLGYQSR